MHSLYSTRLMRMHGHVFIKESRLRSPPIYTHLYALMASLARRMTDGDFGSLTLGHHHSASIVRARTFRAIAPMEATFFSGSGQDKSLPPMFLPFSSKIRSLSRMLNSASQRRARVSSATTGFDIDIAQRKSAWKWPLCHQGLCRRET